MVYGYARCSTTELKQDVERQITELTAMGATEIYSEYESGAVNDRPELAKIMNHAREGDTVICTEVSRLTRSVKHLCEIFETAKEKKLKIIVGSLVVDCTGEIDVITQGMLMMMAVFAEIERGLAISRVKSGIANARKKGIRLGRPKFTAADVPKEVVNHYPLYTAGQITKKEYALLCGVSRPTLNKYLGLLQSQ